MIDCVCVTDGGHRDEGAHDSSLCRYPSARSPPAPPPSGSTSRAAEEEEEEEVGQTVQAALLPAEEHLHCS